MIYQTHRINSPPNIFPGRGALLKRLETPSSPMLVMNGNKQGVWDSEIPKA